MDFAWANGTGPVESSSPFLNLAKSRQQNQHNDSAAKKRTPVGSWACDLGMLMSRALLGTHSAFNSPHKSQTPSLREPASQSFFFSMPTTNDKPLPAVPDQFRTPAFTTPRKIDTDFCSSGGETPITPDNNADSEATPDNMGVRSKASSMFGRSGASSSPNKTTRESLWGRIVGSPGRGEISRGHYSNKAEKKIRKRRARTETRAVRRADDASDSEEGSSESRRNSDDRKDVRSKADAPPQQSTSSITTFFSFLETHPNLPHILSFYAQLLLNVFIVFFIIYIIYSFWSTIRSDVDKKSQEAAAEILAEMAICAQNYRENRCERETRVPAMESVCVNWEKCMSRDPRSVGRARVSAHTFAEIFNSFIEPISYKAMVRTYLA